MTVKKLSTEQKAGSVIRQHVVCGKDGCRCVKGKKHTAYYRYYWTKNRKGRPKLKKRHVKKEDVRKLRQRIQYAKNKKWVDRAISDGTYENKIISLYTITNRKKNKFSTDRIMWNKNLHVIFTQARSEIYKCYRLMFGSSKQPVPFYYSRFPKYKYLSNNLYTYFHNIVEPDVKRVDKLRKSS